MNRSNAREVFLRPPSISPPPHSYTLPIPPYRPPRTHTPSHSVPPQVNKTLGDTRASIDSNGKDTAVIFNKRDAIHDEHIRLLEEANSSAGEEEEEEAEEAEEEGLGGGECDV